MIDIRDIEAAAVRLAGISVRTPLLQNYALDEAVGGKVLIKPECLQVTGSFKIRGAYNFLSQLSPGEAAKGVVAFSSGNHAQGVAAAGSMLGIKTAIVMPEDAPVAKLENTRRLGGEVITYDRYTGDREAIAKQIAADRGAELVPSFDHEHVIAGQGTIGLEIADAGPRELAPQPRLGVGDDGAAIQARVAELVEVLGAHEVVEGVLLVQPGSQLGPINNAPQFQRVIELVDDAKSAGATMVTGGNALEGGGYFFQRIVETLAKALVYTPLRALFADAGNRCRCRPVCDAVAR